MNADSLEPALDRFAQFFVSPLFTPSATARELNAIDSEHAKNVNDDGFRFYQVSPESFCAISLSTLLSICIMIEC